MRDNGARSIWMSCYKQLSLSYQSSGRGGGSPLGRVRAAPPPPQFRARRRCFGVVRGGVARSILRAASHVCAASLRGRRQVCRRPCRLAARACFGGGVVRGRLEIARAAARAARGYVVEHRCTLRCSGAQTTTYGAAQQGYHFLRRHVRRRKYFSGCKCGICAPPAHKLCAQQTAAPLSKSNTF